MHFHNFACRDEMNADQILNFHPNLLPLSPLNEGINTFIVNDNNVVQQSSEYQNQIIQIDWLVPPVEENHQCFKPGVTNL